METPLCAHPSKQACVRCSPRRCRRTGSASLGCRQNVAWAAARGSKRQRAPSLVRWSAMPGPPLAPSLATACGEQQPPQLHPALPCPHRSQFWLVFLNSPSPKKKLGVDLLSCFTLCLSRPVLQATPLISWHSQVDRCLCGPKHLWPPYVCSPSLGVTGTGPGRYPCWPRPDCRADGTSRIPQCTSSRGLR